jgi:hypothetical protein
VESFPNISADATAANYCVKVLNDPDSGSALVTATTGPVDKTARPVQTGTVGTKLDTDANGKILTTIDPSKVYDIRIGADLPTVLNNAPVNVTVFQAKDPVPTSITGLARLIERKFNAEIAKLAPGAAVRCAPNATGDGLRIFADFDPAIVAGGKFDASIGFDDGKTNSLLGLLKLPKGGDPGINVGHYSLGGRKAFAQNLKTAGVSGTDGVKLPGTEAAGGAPSCWSIHLPRSPMLTRRPTGKLTSWRPMTVMLRPIFHDCAYLTR